MHAVVGEGLKQRERTRQIGSDQSGYRYAEFSDIGINRMGNVGQNDIVKSDADRRASKLWSKEMVGDCFIPLLIAPRRIA